MKIRAGLVALTLAIASLASVPAFADGREGYALPPQAPAVVVQPAAPGVVVQPAYGPMHENTYGQGQRMEEARRETAAFVSRVELQANQIVHQVREGVERGVLRPAAVNAVTRANEQLSFTLQRGQREGILRAPEQHAINAQLAQMTRIPAQYRAPAFHHEGRR